jgi:CPA2 family monovalent cation:H+ antiporter-2
VPLPALDVVGEVAGVPVNVLVAIGALMLAAAVLSRVGRRVGLPTIPFFMAAGILLGPGTPGPVLVEDPATLELLATIGLVLLLFHLGVDFPLAQVVAAGRRLLVAAGVYIGLNVTGGLLLGLALGWGVPEALVIAGALGISSSAIVTKLLIELRRLANAETPLILGIVVVEDIFLALYLSLLGPVLGDADSPAALVADIAVSFAFLVSLLLVARYGAHLVARVVHSREEELLTIGVVGLVLLVAGASEQLGVSDAIGALLLGLVVSRTSLRERVERLTTPLRDAFAALFFVVFGLSIDVGDLGEVLLPALAAVLLTVVLNVTAGVVAARMYRLNQRAAANIALTLLGRGEFSLILATLALAAGLDSRVGPFIALYVLVLAVVSPLAAANARLLARRLPDRLFHGDFTYVREETTGTTCGHLDAIVTTTPVTPDGCEECLAEGGTWVHLRLCTTCGHVGCCDDSEGRHATAHFRRTGHPVIESFEPSERWRWCFVDEQLVTGGPPARLDGGIPGPDRHGSA